MTDSNMGIRGVSPFAATPERRRQFKDRSERSLAKHVNPADGVTAPAATDGAQQEPLSLDPGHVLDIKV